MKRPPLDSLVRRIGHPFNDPALLEEALTHRSAGSVNNERLEFLGDSVLSFIISDSLFHRYPNATEGELSRLRASLVNGEKLAEIARALDLGQYLRLGSGELKSGGFRRASILADAMEAIIGAVYLDAGFTTVRNWLLELFQPHFQALPDPELLKDPKTRLQEYLQGRRMALPRYEVTQVTGQSHNQRFDVTCTIEGVEHPFRGSGTSRRRAEQEAALNALESLTGGAKHDA
ncbi:MAG TPA: ribonuclease III [Thiotrichales bacterium]|nr:ribonuclease III [Thiotrichales bacterium]